MPQIDIPVSEALQEALDGLTCDDLRIPSPKPLTVRLPTGGTLKAFTDLSKGIPNDCSMSFNLLLQIAPLLASMECLLKILKVLEPLVKIIPGLAKVPPKPDLGALADLPKAVADLVPCFVMFTNIPLFAIDILLLVRAVLKCLLAQLKSVRDLMAGLAFRLEIADGNDDLLATLNCAQENAKTSAQNLSQAIEPITAILGLVGPILEIAQMPPIELTPPSGPPESLEALDAMVDGLQTVVDAIDEVVETFGGS